MDVTCPKCKVKLKIPDEKIAPDGSRFKCPKCAAVLLVKKPVSQAKNIDKNKVLIAVADPKVAEDMQAILSSAGFSVVQSRDGVDAMVVAVRELPYTAILDVALPKIFGFEVCKQLKSRAETKDVKVILYTSYYDKNKYKRQPTSLYGADDYVEGYEVQKELLSKVQALTTGVPSESSPAAAGKEAPAEQKPAVVGAGGAADMGEWEQKARRLTRTVLSDIFLYNPQKAEDAVKAGNFMGVFSSEVKEGKKLYESRIPKNVREVKDYFADEMNAFLEDKRNRMNA